MHGVIKRHPKLEALPVLGIAIVFVLQAQGNGLAIDVLNGRHIHGRGIGAEPHADGQGHGRQEMRRVIFLVDHLVANQSPACCFGHLHIQALLAVKAQRVRHDERRSASNWNETNFQIRFFKRPFVLSHGLQTGNRQHTGNGGHGCSLAHCAQEVASLCILWKQGLHQSSLDKFLAVSLKLGCLGACTQCGCRSICRDFGMVIGRRVITPATAFQHQGTIGVVGVKELGHGGNLFSMKTRGSMQTTRQLSVACTYFVTMRFKPCERSLRLNIRHEAHQCGAPTHCARLSLVRKVGREHQLRRLLCKTPQHAIPLAQGARQPFE